MKYAFLMIVKREEVSLELGAIFHYRHGIGISINVSKINGPDSITRINIIREYFVKCS